MSVSIFRRSLLLSWCLFIVGNAVALAGSSSECLQCHGEPSLTMTKNGRTISLHVDGKLFASSVHGELECTSCHEGFKASEFPHAKAIKPVNCQQCHSEQQFENFKSSIHGHLAKGKATGCANCHSPHQIKKLSDAPASERKLFVENTCAKCHADVDSVYRSSEHGQAVARGVIGAPVCSDCHDEHEVRPSSNDSSRTSRRREAEMCLRCHRDKSEVRDKVGPSAGFISSYENSVHARAVLSGNEGAAICTDCHGGHAMRKGSDPESKVFRTKIAATCAQCHEDIAEQYRESIHGKALANGITASATCTDCHGEHNILAHSDPKAPTSARNISGQVCSPCHTSVRLTQKYGLAADRFKSYEDSFHGLASQGGSVEVANCASCHGVHDIKPSIDSTSRISPANLAKTCGKCHPGANVNFTRGSVHVLATSGQEKLLYLVSTSYILLILVIIGGMIVHNILDFVKKSQKQLMYRRGILPRHQPRHRLYLRMSLSERIQHATLLVSFVLLVLTGFALKFPEAWWTAPMKDWSPVMFALRGIVHRFAAVTMVLAGIYHCYYVFAVPRGKQLLRDLLPTLQDVYDAIGVVRYNLGLSPDKPKLGRFSYIEKSEYWALVWGTIVMGLTGTILWFENISLGLITKLWWDVAQTVHYYEAWLATLAIIVWHFYFVIFNPDTYPLNLAFWKGTLTEEEMEDEHPLELEKIIDSEQLRDTNEGA